MPKKFARPSASRHELVRWLPGEQRTCGSEEIILVGESTYKQADVDGCLAL
jgi:hypothetical protein